MSFHRTAPPVGAYSPARILAMVVLPEPFSPTTAMISPALTVNEMAWSTSCSVPGYVNDTSSMPATPAVATAHPLRSAACSRGASSRSNRSKSFEERRGGVHLAEHVHSAAQLVRDLLQGEHGDASFGDREAAVDGDGDEQRECGGGEQRRDDAARRSRSATVVRRGVEWQRCGGRTACGCGRRNDQQDRASEARARWTGS